MHNASAPLIGTPTETRSAPFGLFDRVTTFVSYTHDTVGHLGSMIDNSERIVRRIVGNAAQRPAHQAPTLGAQSSATGLVRKASAAARWSPYDSRVAWTFSPLIRCRSWSSSGMPG